MIESMMRAGFDVGSASEAVQRVVAGPGPVVETLPRQAVAREYQYDAAPVAAGNVIHAYDRDVSVVMRSAQPQVIVFADVLSLDECTELIER
jgi:prolyl 4-hydroxylase